MSETTDPAPGPDAKRGFLAPPPDSKPVDHCVRCGVETPPGVSLCDEHNPSKIEAPSATQMHATIFGGIAIGVVGLFLLARLAVSTSGPFSTDIVNIETAPDGAVTLAFTVTNDGDSKGVPDCRVTRDGVPRPDDFAFRISALESGASSQVEQVLPDPPDGSAGYVVDKLSVTCT